MNALQKEILMTEDNEKIKFAVIETTVIYISETLKRIEERFDFIETKFDKKFDQIDNRFNQIDQKFHDTNKEIFFLHRDAQTQFRWIMGAVLGLYGILISLVGKGLFLSH
jgi:hypothetical protein